MTFEERQELVARFVEGGGVDDLYDEFYRKRNGSPEELAALREMGARAASVVDGAEDDFVDWWQGRGVSSALRRAMMGLMTGR